MKYNVRDPKTGRFMKQTTASAVSSTFKKTTPRDPITGRFVSVNSKSGSAHESTTAFDTKSKSEQTIPDWKIEFDKHMEEFHTQMARFDEAMDIFSWTAL